MPDWLVPSSKAGLRCAVKVIVIGSGLIGLTSAYFLKVRGHDVTVLDREEGPGRAASFANGALLTPSMPDPWNAPGSWRVLLASLGRSDSPMQLRLRALPALAGWGVGFLRNSRAALYERNALSNLRLALYSLKVMGSIREQTHIQYGRLAHGSLRVFRDPIGLDRACEVAGLRSSEGLSYRRLSRKQTVELEPALAPIGGQLAGAIHYEGDETGDSHRFCVALAEHARAQGVEFNFEHKVSSLEVRAGQVVAAVSGRERFIADRYVVAAGSDTAPLLKRVGVYLPVQPVKGYSVTFDREAKASSLKIPVIDDDLHAAVVPLEGAIRAAGTAEFAGFNRTLNQARVRNLLGLLRGVLPEEHFDPAAAKSWCGLRPVSVDGVPIIGPTPISNLWVNTGHGHLGWTMAAGSARLLADLTDGNASSIDPAPYAPTRFFAAQ
jgi:D-amino-acid dehydrogenase